MSDFVLSCCSTVDLNRQHLLDRDIHFVCFHYLLDGVTYPDDFGQTMSFDDFYAALSAGADAKTSQVNEDEFENYFTPFLEEGKDILHVCLSSGISGVINSARAAADVLSAKYPERKIVVLDSLCGSGGYGMLVDALADCRDSGMSLEQTAAWCEKNRLRVQHWFFTSDLTFFVKGGRISKASGMLGNLLQLCPMMTMFDDGSLGAKSKVRTKKKAMQAVVDIMEREALSGADYDGKCYLCHAACPEDAAIVADSIQKRFPRMEKPVIINSFGTTIGTHTGPGTIAIFFWGPERAAKE